MNAPVSPPVDINKRVDQFVKLRDKVAELKEKHKDELKPYVEAMEQLETLLLDHLNNTGSDRVGTASGTVYRTEKKSASLADKTAFWTYVVTHADWDMLDYKANPTAVAEYLENNQALPPGVNYTVTQTVGVRRK